MAAEGKISESTCQHGLCFAAVSGEPTQSLIETLNIDFPSIGPFLELCGSLHGSAKCRHDFTTIPNTFQVREPWAERLVHWIMQT